MIRRYCITLLAAVLLIGLLAGCGGNESKGSPTVSEEPVKASTKLDKPPKEAQILSDVNRSKDLTQSGLSTFTGCEIIKRQSNPEHKEDIVYCRLTAETSFLRAERQYKLLYNFYDEGGWILDTITSENEDEWTEDYLAADGKPILESMIWLDYRYSDIRSAGPELISVKSGGKWGYIDKATGKEVIPCQFDYNNGMNFSLTADGGYVAAIKYGPRECYLVDRELNRISDRYESIENGGSYNRDDGAEIRLFNCLHDGQISFLDETGAVVCILPGDMPPEYNTYQRFVDGLCPVENANELYGCIDMKGNEVIPFQYDYLEGSIDGAMVAEQGGKYGAIDKSGKQVIPFTYGSIFAIKSALGLGDTIPDWSDKYAQVRSLGKGSGKFIVTQRIVTQVNDDLGEELLFGLADANENWIIPIGQYKMISSSSTGLFEVVGESSFCLYDWNGNRRTPDFSTNGEQYPSTQVATINGRQGIMPQILSDAEIEQFKKGN